MANSTSFKRQIKYAFGNRVRKKDLKSVLRFVTALTGPERDARLRELESDFGFYQPKQQDFLRAVYTRSYVKGKETVLKDIFTNTAKTTFTELIDRFEDHPQIETPDWDLIQELAEAKPNALEVLLGASDQSGYEEKFSYYIYEKFYIDGTRELEEAQLDAPEGVTEDSIYFISDMGFADGVEYAVNELAAKEIQRLAEDLLEEKP